MLTNVTGGKSASLPGAIVCGGAAGTGHLLYDSLQPVRMFQQWLLQNDLMDAPGAASHSSAVRLNALPCVNL